MTHDTSQSYLPHSDIIRQECLSKPETLFMSHSTYANLCLYSICDSSAYYVASLSLCTNVYDF